MKVRPAFYPIGLAAALLAGFGALGCNQSGLPGQSQSPNDQATDPAAAHPVSLQILDYDGIQKLIESHRGQVVVLDCWSTSCPPCIEEFPKLVALHRNYDASQLACISLSFDFEGLGKPADMQSDVLKFLQSQRATFDNVLSSEPSDVLLKKMQLASIPAVFVYDRQGNVHRFEGSKAYDEVQPLLTELLEAKP